MGDYSWLISSRKEKDAARKRMEKAAKYADDVIRDVQEKMREKPPE